MKDITKQMKEIAKQIEKDSKAVLSVDKLFSSDFMRQYHVSKTIQEIFDEAEVDIAHISKLSHEEKKKLSAVLPSGKIKNWDDFFNKANEYQIMKQLKKKGYSLK